MSQTTEQPNNANYFPNFYGFRLIAAFAVVALHIQLMATRYGWGPNRYGKDLEVLSLGVDFFFILSGFLMTSLIVVALKNNSFRLSRYYLKRALRILPLYYLVVVVVFFAVNLVKIPKIESMPLERNFEEQLSLHLLMLPQVAKSYLPFVPYGGQLWSIGVEIMFYLFWPFLLMTRKPLLTVIAFCAINIMAKVLVVFGLGSLHPVSKFLAMSRFEVLAIGGFAYLVWDHTRADRNAGGAGTRLVRTLITIPSLAWIGILSGCVATLTCMALIPNAVHLVAAVWFALVLLYSVNGVIRLGFLEWPVIRYLGEISYGIYVWHFLAIGAVKGIMDYYTIPLRSPFFWTSFWAGSILATIAISIASYELLEKPINRLRRLL